ncbi:MAG: hypothetical protein K2O00_05595 [Muribaculaceae bacterium]|nr:hypothetical protein [Muribaculaceae bacterium]
MKKLYSFFLLLTMFLFAGNSALAYTLTLQWETPGAVEISAGNIEYFAKPQDVSGKTEYQYTFGNYDNVFVKVSPAAGYSLVKAVQNEDNTVVVEPNAAGSIVFNGNGFSANLTDKTYTIYVEKVSQEEKFTVNAVNGLDYFTATYSNGSALQLEKGEHSYEFSSSQVSTLTIAPKGIPELYNVTLNGSKVYKNNANAYEMSLADGSNIVVQAFENPAAEAPETCKLTFEYGPNMEGCIYTIRDWTKGDFVEKNIVNNTLDIMGYSDIQLNFVEKEYTITAVYLNGENITSMLQTSSFDKSQKIRFVVPNVEAATIRIEGSGTVWGTINFTGYIQGAEGVEFSTTYGGTAIEMPAAQPVTGSISVDGKYTFNSSNSEKYVIPVSEKIGKIFFRPKAGYYIADLYTSTSESGTKEQHSGSASLFPNSDGTYFYMVVKKLDAAYSFNLTATGSSHAKLSSANAMITDAWENPAGLSGTITAGTKAVTFIPNYNEPVIVGIAGDANGAVYLDGAPLEHTVNSDSEYWEFTFTPYYPVEGDGIAAGTKSDVQAYLSSARPSLSGVSLNLEGGATAGFFYSPVRHIANPAGQSLISGTQVIVKPASPDMIVKYKNEQVKLDENGEFIFNVTGNARNNVVTVSPAPKFSEILVDPADGATVKTLSTIKVTLPSVDPTFESMLDYNESVLTQLSVKKGEETVATFGELGDPNADEEGNTIVPIILSTPVVEAGTYTIDIPAGAFVQKKWSEADNAMVEVEGGYKTMAYSGSVTVDPNMISICDDFTLNPEAGSTVEEISVVKLTFNKISAEEYFSGWEFPNATFTNGDQTIQAIVNYDWSSEGENRVMTVTPIDAAEEPAPITAAGTWTMTIAAGTFTYEGETNAEIKAEYTIEAAKLPYTITPEPGSVVEDLSKIIIDFGNVSKIDYNEVAITLTGDQFDGSTTDVIGVGKTRTINFSNPTVEGEYTITIPAGAFTLDGEPSKEVTVKYTFQKSYVLTPESGSTLESFEVVLTFPHATTVELAQYPDMSLTDNNIYATPRLDCVKDASASVPTFVISIPEGMQKPANGKVYLKIYEGSFIVDGKPSVDIMAEYTIDHEVSAEYEITPDGTVVLSDWGVQVAFVFSEDSNVSSEPAQSKIDITLDGVAIPASAYMCMKEANFLMFGIMDNAYNKTGVLRIAIPEGAFTVGGKPSPAVEGVWNIVEPKSFTAKITPEENSSSNKIGVISTIYINFPDATKGEIFNEYGASLRTPDYSYSQNGKLAVVDNTTTMAAGDETADKGVTFSATFPATTKAGNYILTVREGTFTLDGAHESPEISATYVVDPSVTGVEEIFADENGNVTVYTIEGRIVLDNAPAAAIRDLHKGLYIINGQKVILK